MYIKKNIRVLIVDDSVVSRQMIGKGISEDPGIEVVAVASDPFDAKEKIIKTRPNVIVCDVEMPKMNGIEFVRQLLPQYSVPVIMVSGASSAVFEAIEAGAVDFVAKPTGKSHQDIETFISSIIQKIKTGVMAKAIQSRDRNWEAKPLSNNFASVKRKSTVDMIAIGASTGGTEAIFSILRHLPSTIPGIVIVQHIPPVFSKMYAERLDSQTSFSAKEAHTGDYIEHGKVFVAPGDMQMKVRKIGNRYKIECAPGEKVSGHCPSVDFLFESVAKETAGAAIGILLTGMGRDGAKGLLSMRHRGCRTIGQNEASSVVYGMPKAAYDIGAVEVQAALDDIPQLLLSCLPAR
ncbi:MAG: chemotaxis response regulator protein-glutamate methylesterase [Eubacteriales bacterium]|nr:chemotaxis response regulator protein-glutamate methylesterase [Eubacteriales bacterium]